MPGTVRLHHVFATTPDKVYRAFREPDAMQKWLPPNGCVCTVQAGPIGSDAPAEGIISNLLRDRECQNAPTTPTQRQPVEAAGGGIPGAGLIMGGAALAGLGLAAAGGGGSDSRG